MDFVYCDCGEEMELKFSIYGPGKFAEGVDTWECPVCLATKEMPA